jgi:hypothetical protein
MWTDIRWPIGLFFSAVGTLLAGYGLANSSAVSTTSLGINVDLEWGGVLLAFGLIMCFLVRRRRSRGTANTSSTTPPDHVGRQ